MNFPKFPHSAMLVVATNVGKTEYLLRILETDKMLSNSSSLCIQTILDNSETYLSRKWIFDYENVFIMCDEEGKLND